MQYSRHSPGRPLSEFVECFWYSNEAPGTHSKERLMPNGESSIVFNLRDDPVHIYDAQGIQRYTSYGCGLLIGARSESFVIDRCCTECVIGVQFRPGGAFPFFRMPASEAENASLDLEDLWPGKASEIRERLLGAGSAESMFTVLERCLLEQLVRPLELHQGVEYAVRQFGQGARVAAVTEQIGLSSRRFIELFRRQVGLAPKLFCRVRRFQRLLRAIHQRNDIDWVQVALECGYYDQAHFIHDFQVFSGLTPSGYRAAATAYINHVVLS
jgi:AraC-like DNA-binding protein